MYTYTLQTNTLRSATGTNGHVAFGVEGHGVAPVRLYRAGLTPGPQNPVPSALLQEHGGWDAWPWLHIDSASTTSSASAKMVRNMFG